MRAYLERIRNRMQKPERGLLVQSFGALNKGEDTSSESKLSRETHEEKSTSTKLLDKYFPQDFVVSNNIKPMCPKQAI